MKAWLRALVPRFLLKARHRAKLARESRRNSKRTPQEVFSEIYREGKWGTGDGVFCSGAGSAENAIVAPYIRAVSTFLESYPRKPHVVDLGCGDFSVGKQLVPKCASYTGVEVVPELVSHHRRSVGDNSVQFLCLDIIRDELPPAEVCLIRQVLQHLSNDQIGSVLSKLSQYPIVIVSEHYPSDSPSVVPNLDKVHGSGIRLFENSGVYLDEPPFNVPRDRIELMLEVPSHGFDGQYDPGVIRTFRIKF